MGWRTLVVNKHSKLSYQNNQLIYKAVDDEEVIYLGDIDIIILETTDITLTTMLIKRLVDENILVIFCDDKRLPASKILPFYGRHDSSLQLSRQVHWQEDRNRFVWTQIIRQKILNQSLYLGNIGFLDKSNALMDLYNDLQPFDPTNREGHAARIYFNKMFGNKFTRDQENAINAGLDYGYTLLMSMFAREIVLTGCMTQFGLKHANQYNDFNLASDIMEPFRPLVDQIVYENRAKEFVVIKRQLFDLFTNTYFYAGKAMFLTNIVSDYTKKVVKVLNGELDTVPTFSL